MNEIEQLVTYLYTFDARAAGVRLVEQGTAAVAPLIAVLDGSHDLPDLPRLKAAGVAQALLSCVELTPQLDSAAAKERAAYLLGDIGDTRAVEPLIAAYRRESERHLCLAIARALGKIGDPRAVDTLIAALASPAWTPDYGILVADLDRIGGERAVEPLIGLLQRPGYSYGSAARAAQALAARRGDPRVLAALCAALRLDAEFSTLEALCAALGEIGDARGARALLALISQMIALPAECWDEREENLSETERGVIFHVLKTEFQSAAAAVRRIGDVETTAALDRALADAPGCMPKLAPP